MEERNTNSERFKPEAKLYINQRNRYLFHNRRTNNLPESPQIENELSASERANLWSDTSRYPANTISIPWTPYQAPLINPQHPPPSQAIYPNCPPLQTTQNSRTTSFVFLAPLNPSTCATNLARCSIRVALNALTVNTPLSSLIASCMIRFVAMGWRRTNFRSVSVSVSISERAHSPARRCRMRPSMAGEYFSRYERRVVEAT